jgi:hypothetical protein
MLNLKPRSYQREAMSTNAIPAMAALIGSDIEN